MALASVLGPITRLAFRYQLRGLERVPPPPVLFVGNHNGGGVVEILCMLAAWREAWGESRPVVGLAHDLVLATPGVGHATRAIGGVPASRDEARRALARGQDVLVFPGGDLDACRPFYRPRDVLFGRRRGYVSLARESGVALCPVATIGSHFTYTMLPGGLALARLLGLKERLRLERVPLPLGALAGVAGVAGAVAGEVPVALAALGVGLGVLPNPVRVTSEVLSPTSVAANEDLEEAHRRIHGALQLAVRRMEHDRSASRRPRPDEGLTPANPRRARAA